MMIFMKIKKYIFYIKLLIFLFIKLNFSVNSIKEFCIKRLKNSPTDYYARFLLAELFRSEGNNAEAIDQYNKLVTNGFRNAKVVYGLALSSFREQMYDESQSYFKSLLEMNFNNKVALDHLGRIDLIKNNCRKSIMYFERSLKLDPKDQLILTNIAYCYYEIGDYEKSYEAYQKAFELNPSSELEKDMNVAKQALERERT